MMQFPALRSDSINTVGRGSIWYSKTQNLGKIFLDHFIMHVVKVKSLKSGVETDIYFCVPCCKNFCPPCGYGHKFGACSSRFQISIFKIFVFCSVWLVISNFHLQLELRATNNNGKYPPLITIQDYTQCKQHAPFCYTMTILSMWMSCRPKH